MTFYTPDDTQVGGFVPQTDQPLPIHIDLGYFDTIPFAARTSWMGKAIAEAAQWEPTTPYTQPPDPDFDPFQHIQGYEDGVAAFADAENLADVMKIRQRIDDQRRAEGILSMSGGTGLAAELTVGLADPLNFIGGVGLVKNGAKGGSLIADLAEGALLGGGIGVAEEALQKRFDPTYTPEGAGYRVSASALLMGALGGGAGTLARIYKSEGRIAADADINAVLRTAADGIDRDLTIPAGADPLVPEGTLSSAASRTTTLDQETLKSAFGVERVVEELTPMMRGLQSGSLEMRRATQDLIQVPLRLEKNLEGIASPRPVETMVRLWDANLARAITAVDDTFLKYRLGMVEPGGVARIGGALRAGVQDMTKSTGGKLTRQQFKEEIGKAMRRNDTHAIPEVAAAAKQIRKELIEPLKNRAIEAGLLPEDIDEMLKTAPSYLTRVYNRGKIVAQRDGFEDVLYNSLKRWQADAGARLEAASERLPLIHAKIEKLEARVKELKTEAKASGKSVATEVYEIEKNLARYRMMAETTANTIQAEKGLATSLDGELRDSVRQITDKVLGQQPGRLNFEPVPLTRGPMKERTLNFVSDAEIEDFLESDIEHIARVYKHTMASDSELAARFGRADMEPQIQSIKEDYARLRKELKDDPNKEKKFQKLNKQEADDIRDLTAMRDLIRGTYGLPDNPAGFAARTARVMKQANFLRLLGGMTISSIPDLGRPVMVHGIERTMMGGVRPLVQNWKGAKLMAKEARLAAVGLDMVLDNRTMQLTDIFDDYGRLSKFERGMSWMTSRMGLATLMTPWNSTLKQFSSIVAQSRMLKAITDPASRTAKDSEWLAMLGIDDEMSAKIAKQFAKHGEEQDGGVMWANTDAWSSRDAVEAYRAALLKSVDSTIVTPGVGDRPLWMSTTLGSVLGQFRSFSMASTQQVALAGLQQRDAAVLNGLLLSTGLGMLSYALKTDSEKRSSDPGKWILEGIDRAGVLGILSDAAQISTRMAGLNLGGSRYSGRENWEVFGGPSVGLLKDAGTAIAGAGQAALTGDGFSDAEISAARRLIPFQNLFYIRRLFDAAQEGISSSGYGVPQ